MPSTRSTSVWAVSFAAALLSAAALTYHYLAPHAPRPAARHQSVVNRTEIEPNPQPAREPVPEPPQALATPQTIEPPPPIKSNPQPPTPKPAASRRQVAPAPVEPQIPEPVAREALSFVGSDPVAEQVWYQAINDPNLSADARKNLIEDLNEDGFPDHRNITPDDLPLILNRLALIEEVAPDAMDEVNAAAFEEAYKDLVNMLARLTQ